MADEAFILSVSFPTGTGAYNDRQAVGARFINTSGTDIIITQLARWVISGNSQTHAVGIYTSNSFSSPVRTVTVNCSGATPTAFLYGSISAYTWTAGTSIFIMSTENNGGDLWWGGTTAYPSVTTCGVASVDSAVSVSGTITPSGQTSTAWGPVNFKFSSPSIPGWTKAGTIYTTNGLPYAVSSAITDATVGDTIKLPVSGSFTWGADGSGIFVSKAVIIDGQGSTVNISSSGPSYSNGGVLNNSGAARITGFTFQQPLNAAGHTTAIKCTGTAGWRVDHNTYEGATSGDPGYFIYADAYGLIDHNTLNTYIGNDEPVVMRGPGDAWTTAANAGTVNAIYFEDNTKNGPAYMEANSNGRFVARFNTFNDTAKSLDGHGYWTNDSPPLGVRLTEFYYNTFTGTSGSYTAIEVRGGMHYGFFNSTLNNSAGYQLTDYGYQANNGNWGVYQTPLNYPLFCQIGTGQMSSINATALVAYQRAQINSPGSTTWTSIGFPSNNSTAQGTATGAGSGSGTAYITPATEPAYVFGNTQNGSVWGISNGNVNADAITLYQTQTGNPSATFTGATIILSNRNYFADAGAAANTGAYVGTAATMAGTTPVGKTNQGFWVTNEGSWRAGYSGTSGRLYVSNGSTWVLSYTPYTYPHPLQASAPYLISASVNAAGTSLILTWSESCTTGSGGAGGVTLTASGGAVTVNTPPTGSGSNTYTYPLSRTISGAETLTTGYTQPGNGIEATTGGADVASYSGASVTNNSSINSTQASSLRPLAAISGGF